MHLILYLILALYYPCAAVVNPHKAASRSQPKVRMVQSPFQPHGLFYQEVPHLLQWFGEAPMKEPRVTIFRKSPIQFRRARFNDRVGTRDLPVVY